MASQLHDLLAQVNGRVIDAHDDGYDEARAVWNAMIERRPAAVVQAADVADIVAVVGAAGRERLPLAVRGGGHNVAGNGTVDDGLVLDLSPLRGVEVNPDLGTVRVQGGATLADVDAATEPQGLAVPLGVISATGVAGLTLGGGVGWLTRAYGLTADNLVSAQVVTADGTVVTADEQEHPDLLWALRGGGGNFGVVSEFTFRAATLGPQVFAGNFVYRPDAWPRTWRALEEWTRDLPDAMTTITTTMTPPPALELGEEPVLLVGFAWAGQDRQAATALVDRLRALAPPDDEEVGEVRWVEWQSAVDVLFPKGVRAYWRNTSFDRMDEEVIEVLVRRGREQAWLGTAFDVHHMGGAFARVPPAASPFPQRDARFWLNVYGFWTDPADDAERVDFVRGMAADMEPLASGGQYVNFQGQEAAGHRTVDPRVVFGPAAYERLLAVKRRYDPDNVFRLNHNIDPA